MNTIKSESWGVNNIVTNITVYKTPIDAPNYILAGKGVYTPGVVTALADANATYIDAKGITAATLLESANPNCLFVANAGKLTNTKNVIVDGTCENLELTDQKPFNAPFDFTATTATFSKTVSAAEYATLVLPYNADLPVGVEAYDIESLSGSVLNTNKAFSITANMPVLLKNEGTYNFTKNNVDVVRTPDGVQTNGLLNGVYATTDAPVGTSYVLQNKGGDVNFYKTSSGTKVNAFRAYLTTNTETARLTFDFNSETTGITDVRKDDAKGVYYNLNGQRVKNPGKGLYVVGTTGQKAKKVINKTR